MLAHVSLCSGIGGIDLAAEWAGFASVAVCDNHPFCQEVLSKRFPGAALYKDLRGVSAESIGTPVDLLSAGIPCQPFSVAGKRKGTDDERFIWPEVCRIVGELRPSWVLIENVRGFVSLGLDTVAADLEAQGYAVGTMLYPACAVGAPHRRERTFVVAHATGGQDGRRESGAVGSSTRGGQGLNTAVGVGGPNVAHASGGGLPRHHGRRSGEFPEDGHAWRTYPDGRTWDAEPSVGRVAHGVPRRVDRLRALGNAVVPQQVYPILRAIADYELGRAV